jgi:tetratricopeptide (TPR) repeat protein
MSRSYHTTRKDVRQAYRKAQGGDDLRVEEYHKLREEYFKKRRTKSHIKEERQLSESVNTGLLIDALPIEIKEKSEYLHYPASEKDIRALLKRMPQGLIDGLSKITLTLGEFEQHRPEQPLNAASEKDPYIGRIGRKVVKGIYRPSCLGTYFLNKNEIKLYGYIFDPAIENRQVWDFYLRIHMLETFVHELAHHYDFTNRVSRGRWRMDDDEKAEIYAETLAHEWLIDYVIPYIKEAYSEKLNNLNEWMNHYIGLALDITLLVGDFRATGKNGTIRIGSFFNTSDAFEEFVGNIQLGKDLNVSRIELADDLHMAKEFDVALEILDLVLEKDRKNADAICLYGEIYEHLERYSEAIEYAKKALQLDKTNVDAHHVMCDSYAGLKEWESLLKWACRGLYIAENKWNCSLFLQDKAEAEVELHLYDSACETILEVKELYGKRPIPKRIQRWETRLEKKMRGI